MHGANSGVNPTLYWGGEILSLTGEGQSYGQSQRPEAAGMGSWGGLASPPHQLRGLRSAVRSPSRVWDWAPENLKFGPTWDLKSLQKCLIMRQGLQKGSNFEGRKDTLVPVFLLLGGGASGSMPLDGNEKEQEKRVAAECRLWRAGCRLWRAGCRLWRAECRLWRAGVEQEREDEMTDGNERSVGNSTVMTSVWDNEIRRLHGIVSIITRLIRFTRLTAVATHDINSI